MSNLQSQMGLSDEQLASYFRQAKYNELQIATLEGVIETLNKALAGIGENVLAELSRDNAQLRHSLRLAENNANFVSAHIGKVMSERREDIQAGQSIVSEIHGIKERTKEIKVTGGKNGKRKPVFNELYREYFREIEEGKITKSSPEEMLKSFLRWLQDKYRDAVDIRGDLVTVAIEDKEIKKLKKDTISRSLKKINSAEDN